MSDSRGVLTMAFGHPKYARAAARMAASFKLHNPLVPLVLVTDAKKWGFASRDFDELIDLDPSLGSGLEQKLSLDVYSPFTESIYIDSDCLIAAPLEPIWKMWAGQPFCVYGRMVEDGDWWGGDIRKIRGDLGIAGPLCKFNSGFIYWRKGELSSSVFSAARTLHGRYAELGFEKFSSALPAADEPLLAAGMALAGVSACQDGGITARTLVDVSGKVRVDVVQGPTRFRKEGVMVEPAVVHFAGLDSFSAIYLRESLKVKLARRLPEDSYPKWGRVLDVLFGGYVALDGKLSKHFVACLVKFSRSMVERLPLASQRR